jgi:hypothetical protein
MDVFAARTSSLPDGGGRPSELIPACYNRESEFPLEIPEPASGVLFDWKCA